MSNKSDLVCAITMMYPVSVPNVLVQDKLQKVRELAQEVQNQYQEQTNVVDYLEKYVSELQENTVSVSRLARMLCILQTTLKVDKADDFISLFFSITSKGSASFQQLLTLYDLLEQSEYSLQKELLQWHNEMYQQYVETVKKTWQKYMLIKNRLIKIRLRMRIEPNFDSKGLQWTFIADFDDVKQQLAQEQKVLRAWSIQHHLLTQVQREYDAQPNLLKGVMGIFLGASTSKKRQDVVSDSSWGQVKTLLHKYIEQRCRNHSTPTIIAKLCGHKILGTEV